MRPPPPSSHDGLSHCWVLSLAQCPWSIGQNYEQESTRVAGQWWKKRSLDKENGQERMGGLKRVRALIIRLTHSMEG